MPLKPLGIQNSTILWSEIVSWSKTDDVNLTLWLLPRYHLQNFFLIEQAETKQ